MYIVPAFIPHAGCPHQCSFCNQKTISGQQTFSLDAAYQQIMDFLAYLPAQAAKEIAFFGGSFTALPLNTQKQLLKFANSLFVEHNITSIRISTRPDCIDYEILTMLRKFHVQTIELGVQSLDDTVLTHANRGHDAACVYKAAHLIRAQGFTLGLQLMVGLPKQDWYSIVDTAKQLSTIRPDLLRIYSLLVLPHTPLQQEFASGSFLPLPLSSCISQAAYIYNIALQANINVIRIGLQADEFLTSPDNIVAGHYHPAFGEMVQEYRYRNMIAGFLDSLPYRQHCTLHLKYPNILTSKVIGQHKYNKLFFAKHYPYVTIFWHNDNSVTDLQISIDR